jgi:hypothetical protein
MGASVAVGVSAGAECARSISGLRQLHGHGLHVGLLRLLALHVDDSWNACQPVCNK